MSNISWYKIWYVGNGGMDCEKQYVEMYDHDGILDEDDRHSEMAAQVKYKFGSLPYSVRSVHWDKVTTLPDSVIDKEIKNSQYTIDNVDKIVKKAKQNIAKLNSMRETK